MKRLHIFISILLGLTLCVGMLVTPVSADIGNSFDDGDWGGGYDYDVGGDWGGDWGNDWSGGDDYDYDIGYDDYYDSDFSFGGFSTPASALIVVLIIIAVFYLRSKKSGTAASSAQTMRQQGNPNRANLYNEAAQDEDAVVAKVRENDPDFSESDFKAYVEDCYLQLTEAWEKRDWSIARNFESDTLFNVHRRQLEEYIEQKKTNHMDSQCVLSKTLTGYENDGKTETLVVRLNATLVDYVTDDATGAVISGTKEQRYNRFYRLEFIRTAGTKTAVEHGLTSHECPSCGAPLNLNATGRCEYCQNVITSGDFTWVLNAYGRWN